MAFIIAHRGFSAKFPENTIVSIMQAIDLGVEYIEIDIHLTKDLIPVVIHDPDLYRTSNARSNLRVESNDFSILKDFDLGSWHHPDFHHQRLPTLSEVMALDFKHSKLMIEIKKDHLPTEIVASRTLGVVKNFCDEKSPIPHYFGSFDPAIVQAIQKELPEAKTIGILEEIEAIDTFLLMKTPTLAIWVELLNQKLISTLKAYDVEIFTFTVNDLQKYHELVAMGVDGIITDNPLILF